MADSEETLKERAKLAQDLVLEALRICPDLPVVTNFYFSRKGVKPLYPNSVAAQRMIFSYNHIDTSSMVSRVVAVGRKLRSKLIDLMYPTFIDLRVGSATK